MCSLGSVTDGEWNKIRTKGVNRPVSIIQIMMDAKEEARKTRVRTIEQYLKPCKILEIMFIVFWK